MYISSDGPARDTKPLPCERCNKYFRGQEHVNNHVGVEQGQSYRSKNSSSLLKSNSDLQQQKRIISKYFISLYKQISTIASVLLNLLPFLSIIILNCLLYQTIKKKTFLLPPSSTKERRDIFVTGILTLIVIVYASCHSIRCVLNVIELISTIKGTKVTQTSSF